MVICSRGGGVGGGGGSQEWKELTLDDGIVLYKGSTSYSAIIVILSGEKDGSLCMMVDFGNQNITIPDQTNFSLDEVNFDASSIAISFSPGYATSAWVLENPGLSLPNTP